MYSSVIHKWWRDFFMRVTNSSVKQNLIRRYILNDLCPLCKDEPVPLNELAIARHFGVNRLTVRSACADWIASGMLALIPGRRGYFIMPHFVRMTYTPIGIIGDEVMAPILDSGNFNILKHFADAMGPFHGDYQFLALQSDEPSKMLEELLSSPIQLFFFFGLHEKHIPVVEGLLKEKRSLIVFAPSYNENFVKPSGNTLYFDFSRNGHMRLETIARGGFHRPLYLDTCKAETFFTFCREGEKYGIECSEKRFYNLNTTKKEEFIRLLTKKEVDCIVAQPNLFFHELFSEIKEFENVPIYMDDCPHARYLHKEFPSLDIRYFPYSIFEEKHKAAGREAAKLLKKSFPDKPIIFSNRLLNPTQNKKLKKGEK